MPKTTFNVGDKVQWTHAMRRSQEVILERRDGVILELDDKKAKVRRLGKRRAIWIAVKRLRRPDEESQVTEFVEAMRQSQ